MTKLITIITVLIFLIPASALAAAKTAESKTSPPVIQKIAPGMHYYNYNIQEIQKDPDGDGPLETETFYQYNYVVIKDKLTKLKVLDAIAEAESSTSTADIENVATHRSEAMNKLAEISAMSYSQIDTHIDDTFSGLSTAQRNSLKKLYKAVLALIKNMDLE